MIECLMHMLPELLGHLELVVPSLEGISPPPTINNLDGVI